MEQASSWLCQAEIDLRAMSKMASVSEGGPFYSLGVWLASQVVEKALKGAMLRTCGLTQEELAGKNAHDLSGFYQRLKRAVPQTEPQRRAQQDLPGDESDMGWLKHAYLAARYPNACAGQIPANAYSVDDFTRAEQIAHQMVRWAKASENLPSPTVATSTTVLVVEEAAVPATAPPEGPRNPQMQQAELADNETPLAALKAPAVPTPPALTRIQDTKSRILDQHYTQIADKLIAEIGTKPNSVVDIDEKMSQFGVLEATVGPKS